MPDFITCDPLRLADARQTSRTGDIFELFSRRRMVPGIAGRTPRGVIEWG